MKTSTQKADIVDVTVLRKTENLADANYLSMGKTRGTFSVLDIENLYRQIVAKGLGNYCLVERRTSIFRLYYDIDIVNGKMSEKDMTYIHTIDVEKLKCDLVETIVDVITETMDVSTRYIYSDKKYVDGTPGNKYKLHLYFPEIEVNSEIALALRKLVIDKLQKIYGLDWDTIVDKSIYVQNGLQLLYQKKPLKKQENIKQTKQMQEVYVINVKKSTYPIPQSHVERLRITSIRTNKTTPNCVFKNDIIENTIRSNAPKPKPPKKEKTETRKPIDNPLVDVGKKPFIMKLLNLLSVDQLTHNNTWIRIMYFCKKYGLQKEAHELSKKTSKYDANEIDKLFRKATPLEVDIGTICRYAKEANEVEYLKLKEEEKLELEIKSSSEIYKREQPEPDLVEHSRYISENAKKEIFKSSKKCIFVEAYCGTGKTTLLNDYIRKHPRMSYCSITSNRCLSITHKNSIKGCSSYLDRKDGEINERKKSLSFEQLYTNDRKYDLVIIDEAASFIMKYSSPTVKKLCESMIALVNMVKCCKKLIVLDSTITDSVFLQFSSMVKGDYFYYKNTYRSSFGKKIKIHKFAPTRKYKIKDGISKFLEKFKKNIETSKQMIIFSDTRRMCLLVKSILKKKYKSDRLLVITADEGNQEELYNCNETFADKIVISSPKIIYGLDIKLRYGTGDVISIMKGRTMTSRLLYQQINRCRELTDVNVLYCASDKVNYNISYDDHVKAEKYKFDMYMRYRYHMYGTLNYLEELCTKVSPYEVKLNMNNMFTIIYMHETWYNKILDYDKLQMFRILCSEQGFTIEDCEFNVDEKVEGIDEKAIVAENHAKMVKLNKKYLDGKLDEEHRNYGIIKEKMDKRVEYVNLSKEEITNADNKGIVDVITDDNKISTCVRCCKLFMDESGLKRYYNAKTSDGDGKLCELTLFNQEATNPKNMICLQQLEKIAGLKRTDDLDINNCTNKEFKVSDLDNMKGVIKDTLYEGRSVACKIERYKKKLATFENCEDPLDVVRDLLCDVYNKVAGCKIIRKEQTSARNGGIIKHKYKYSPDKEIVNMCKLYLSYLDRAKPYHNDGVIDWGDDE